MCAHRSDVKRLNNYPLYRAINQHGIENFYVHVVRECATKDDLDGAEIQAIAEMKTVRPNGYNLRSGGARGKHSQATIELLRKINTGKQLSAAHRQAISEGLRRVDRSWTEERRLRVSMKLKGRTFSAEWLAKIAASRKGWRPTAEMRAAMSARMRGRKYSEEYKERHSRGENNPRAKLTVQEVEEIREIYKSGGISQADIAAAYGVNQTNVGFIVRGVRWLTNRPQA
jgi:DNA-binding transcriptional regulator YiaG